MVDPRQTEQQRYAAQRGVALDIMSERAEKILQGFMVAADARIGEMSQVAKWVGGILAALLIASIASMAGFMFAHTQQPSHAVAQERLDDLEEDLIREVADRVTAQTSLNQSLFEIAVRLGRIEERLDIVDPKSFRGTEPNSQ